MNQPIRKIEGEWDSIRNCPECDAVLPMKEDRGIDQIDSTTLALLRAKTCTVCKRQLVSSEWLNLETELASLLKGLK